MTQTLESKRAAALQVLLAFAATMTADQAPAKPQLYTVTAGHPDQGKLISTFAGQTKGDLVGLLRVMRRNGYTDIITTPENAPECCPRADVLRSENDDLRAANEALESRMDCLRTQLTELRSDFWRQTSSEFFANLTAVCEVKSCSLCDDTGTALDWNDAEINCPDCRPVTA